MKVCQLLAKDAGPYARKCSETDRRALQNLGIPSVLHDLSVSAPNGPPLDLAGSIALLYGASRIPQDIVRKTRRCIADEPVSPSLITRLTRWAPAVVTTPIRNEAGSLTYLPEAVTQSFFEIEVAPRVAGDNGGVIGFVRRAGSPQALTASIGSRIVRFRDDISFCEFDSVPTPLELAAVHVWIDPAIDADDFGGGTAEALVAGVPVVASRTPVNVMRLANGQSGFLLPPGDANEFVHVTLNALFKPETTRLITESARSTADRFRPEYREAALQQVLQSLEDRV